MANLVEYHTRPMVRNNMEILDQFNWSIKFTHFPTGVYYPGDTIFYSRVIKVSGCPEFSHDIQKMDGPAGFQINQQGDVNHNDATISITFVDYEDGSIDHLFMDWMNKIQEPFTKVGLPKQLLYCDLQVQQLNTIGTPVVEWNFYSGLPSSYNGFNQEFGPKHALQPELTLQLSFEFWTRTNVNV